MPADMTKFRKTIISPFTGQKYSIRKIRRRVYLTELGVLPIEIAGPVKEQLNKLADEAKKRPPDKEADERVTRIVLANGVAEPGVWFGEPDQCPDGQLPYADMGDDVDWLFGQVVQFGQEMSGLKDTDEFFRGAGAGDTGPDGAQVRDPSVSAPATGNA